MHQFFLNESLADLDQPIILNRKEYQHVFVLRLHEGEEFVLSDGHGQEHLCEVTAVDKTPSPPAVWKVATPKGSLIVSSCFCKGYQNVISSSSSSKKPSSSAPIKSCL